MMKKNGFTLAEVLITLAIIGVVATMTLPALMTNTGEQQAKTGLKKAINTLTEGINMHEAITNVNFDTMVNSETAINDGSDDDEGATLVAFLRARTSIDYAITEDGGNKVDPKQNGAPDANVNTVVYLRDGSSIMFNNTTTFVTDVADDGFTKGLVIVVDTNGKKGPNLLSNCAGLKLGKDETIQEFKGEKDDFKYDDCADKSQRVINDRFLIRLRGNIAQPEGPASNWAYNS